MQRKEDLQRAVAEGPAGGKSCEGISFPFNMFFFFLLYRIYQELHGPIDQGYLICFR